MRGLRVLLGVAALALFGAAGTANALVIDFDSIITGFTPDTGSSPWLSATITDVTGGVDIVFSTTVVNPEFVTAIYFSYPTGTDCSPGNSPASTGPWQLCHTFAPALLWDGPTSAAIHFAGFSESLFGVNSAGWLAAAHIQGIQPDCSGWVGALGGGGTVNNGSGTCGSSVPEPGTLSLLGLGLLGLGLGFRRRRKI